MAAGPQLSAASRPEIGSHRRGRAWSARGRRLCEPRLLPFRGPRTIELFAAARARSSSASSRRAVTEQEQSLGGPNHHAFPLLARGPGAGRKQSVRLQEVHREASRRGHGRDGRHRGGGTGGHGGRGGAGGTGGASGTGGTGGSIDMAMPDLPPLPDMGDVMIADKQPDTLLLWAARPVLLCHQRAVWAAVCCVDGKCVSVGIVLLRRRQPASRLLRRLRRHERALLPEFCCAWLRTTSASAATAVPSAASAAVPTRPAAPATPAATAACARTARAPPGRTCSGDGAGDGGGADPDLLLPVVEAANGGTVAADPEDGGAVGEACGSGQVADGQAVEPGR